MELEVIEASGVRLSRVSLKASMKAVCPLTGITDIYDVLVEYEPKGDRYIEAYSFERMLKRFESEKRYQEEITRLIAEKICGTGAARRVRVMLKGVHGGVEIETETVMECGS